MLTLEFIKDRAGFNAVIDHESSVAFVFTEAPKNTKITANNNAVTFDTSSQTKAVIHQAEDDEKIHCVLTSSKETPVEVIVSFSSAIEELTSQEFAIVINDHVINLNVFDASARVSNNTIVFTFTSAMRFELQHTSSSGLRKAFSMLTLSNLVIPSGKRAPQFYIDIGDHTSEIAAVPTELQNIQTNSRAYYFKAARPVRQGLPVLSTVPAPSILDGDTSKTSAEKYMMSTGKGGDTITLVFLAQSTYEIDSSTHNVYLMLGLPNGIDTVAAPVKVLMSPYPAAGVVKAWTASYTFHVEDTINYVDGICYIGVYTDTTYQHALPLGLEIGTSTNVGEGRSIDYGY